LLYSTDRKWFVGEYKGGGQFATVTDCPLQEDGSFSQLWTHIYKSYFVAWALLEPPFFPTTVAVDEPICSRCGENVAYENGVCWDCLDG